LERASSLLYEWNAARNARLNNNVVNGNGEHSQSARMIKWSKPNRGRMKCNIDASFPNNENRIGIGICIRDDEGASFSYIIICRGWSLNTPHLFTLKNVTSIHLTT